MTPGTPAYAPYTIKDALRSGAIVRLGSPGEVSQINLGGMLDGTSNTILYGEKRLDPEGLGTYQTDDNEGYTCGWDHDVNRNASLQPLPDKTARFTGWGEYRFGATHPVGFNVVMCDGAVRFVTYNIERLVFHRLGSRNEGGAVGAP